MTDLRQAMQMALEALQCSLPFHETVQRLGAHNKAITALRAQLEQPKQEPVHGDIRALRYRIFELEGEVLGYKRMLDVAEAPPQRKPLTDEEIEKAYRHIYHNVPDGSYRTTYYWIEQGIRYAEQAHGIRGEA